METVKKIVYYPTGVCSKMMEIEVVDGVVRKAVITGGCSGNTQGVCALIGGMRVDEVIERLEGIDCKGKGTSCPDQLTKALKMNK